MVDLIFSRNLKWKIFKKKDNPLTYWLPSGDHGYYYSYEDLKMFYYDANGIKHNVNL